MIYTLDKINEMAEGDEDFIISVVSVFLEEVPEDMTALENAIASEDFEQIGRSCRAHHGTYRALFRNALCRQALRLELHKKKPRLDGAF